MSITNKIKVEICADELYPFYDFCVNYGVVVDVDKKTAIRWKRVLKSFNKIQTEMSEHYKNSSK